MTDPPVLVKVCKGLWLIFWPTSTEAVYLPTRRSCETVAAWTNPRQCVYDD